MIATGENTTTPSGAGERPRCLEGRKTDNPCWRPAVERAYANDEEPTICAEHLRALELALKRAELRDHLDNLGRWVATWDDPKVGETRLQYHAFTTRAKMLEEFWLATVEAEAADFIADQGPDEEPLTFEEAKRRTELALKSTALSDAHLMFEDLQAVPDESFPSGNRWNLAAALQSVERDVSAEWDRFAREMGRR